MNNHIPHQMSHRQASELLMVENLKYPLHMERQKLPAFPPIMELWRSRDFLAQVYQPENGAVRVSINRTAIYHESGRWVDGITWDELQRIKREIGMGEKFAVEIYPADSKVINLANMRHLFILDQPLACAW